MASARACAFAAAAVAAFASAAAGQRAGDPGGKPAGLPLAPERKVEFSTDEGTWMSVDVSPDGRTIVFDLLGDLYSVPIEGGEARPLTRGMAFDAQPRFSPDGKRLVFISDRDGADNLWTIAPDGSDPKQVTREQRTLFASPTWTPDGEFILVSRKTPYHYDSAFELWLHPVRGGSGVAITKGKPTPIAPPTQWHNALGGVASPDGHYFYYAHRTGGLVLNDTPTLPDWQVARRDRDSGEEDRLTQGAGGGFRPLLSPDGRLLVYGTRRDARTALRARDLLTGEDRLLLPAVSRDDQESLVSISDILPGYAFLPGGRELVVSYGGKIHRVDVATGASRLVPFTARVSQDLGPSLNFPVRVDEGPVRARLIQGARPSPDGKRLAFSALGRVYVGELSTPGAVLAPKRVTTAEVMESQPSWSTDGAWLAYVTWTQDGGHIWKVRSDGRGQPQRLTEIAGFYRDPVWSPDGKRLVALRASRQARLETRLETPLGLDLVWLPAAGGAAEVIAPARGAGRPHFGPETDRVYLYAGHDLLSMRWDGTDRRRHLTVVMRSGWGRPDILPWLSQAVLSPDGAHALLLVRDQLYVVEVPRLGGEPPAIDVESPVLPLKRLTDVGADEFGWADGGATIEWTVGSTFRRQRLAAVSFEKDESASSKAAESFRVTIDRPRRAPKGTVVLRGASVITMNGDEVIPKADLVVTGNRIAAVGTPGSVVVPEGATIVDVAGMSILPGLIDIHDHMAVRRDVFEPQPWSLLVTLAYGVTTARDPQGMKADMFAYGDLIDAGEMLGPRLLTVGQGIFYVNDFKSYEETAAAVSRYAEHYRAHTLKSYLVGNRRQRQWMVAACKRYQLMPTTEGGADLRLDLTHVIDGFSGNEHNMPVVPLYRDVTELVARSGIFYTPTIMENTGGPHAENYFFQTIDAHDDPKVRRFMPHGVLDARTRRSIWYREDEHIFKDIAESAARIIRAGGRVCIGSHGNFKGLGTHWEIWAMHTAGLTNLETLRAATLHGAEALGLAEDLGSLEPGKLADLIVLTKDPLQDIRSTSAIRYVMKNGELYDADTLDQVWPEKKALPAQWWWKEDGAEASDAATDAGVPLPATGAVIRDCPECPEMMVVPAGRFVMGSPPDEAGRDADEGPQHTVTFARPFAIGRYEVTFDEWDACVAAGACSHVADEGWGRGRRPVINVSHEQSVRYAEWLSEKTGRTYRLPSEAEWEYAARGGSTTAWFWGESPARACEFAAVGDRTTKTSHPDWTVHECDDGYTETAPVGSFKPNGFGLWDVVGNVWEWVADCYNGSYDGAPVDGSAWREGDCSRRVDRGGGWYNKPEPVRMASRYGGKSARYNRTLGFRVARTLP
jgi:formylglycine-generating enzyme required for sulfatase activity/Tol biopolymer transport system component